MSLLYKIEIKSPTTLLVRLEEVGSRRILYLDTLKALAKESDREALSLLTKIHLKTSRSADTLSFQQIEVSAAGSLEALRLMAKTGRLSFQSKTLAFENSAAKIYWKGEKHSEKACTLAAFLQFKGELIPLTEVTGAFGWFIWGTSIGQIVTDIPWKWVELFFKGPLTLEGIQKKKFLEEEPSVVWKEVEPSKPLQVFPVLILKDASGCFANLSMDYPGFGRIPFEDLSPTINGSGRLKKEEEQWEKDLIETGFTRKVVGDSRYYCPSERARESLLFLLELGWQILDFRGKTVCRQGKTTVDLREEKGEILVAGRVAFGEKETSLRSCSQSRMWVDLDEESVGLLDKNQVLQGEGGWNGDILHLPKGQIAALFPLLEKEGVQWEETLLKTARGLREGAGIELALPGPSFQGKLLPYQQKGVDWLSFLYRWGFSGLLADEMGLGKTVQVLAFFSLVETNLPILVVAPTSLLFNWRSEIGRFLPHIEVRMHAGGERLKDLSGIQGVILTSYALLRIDEELFAKQPFEAIVLDESNAIKTASTQTAKAAFLLKGRFKIALSGTPIENRPEELWSQFRFLMPQLFGEKADFLATQAEAIRRKLRPFILRRRKEEVQLDLPEKVEQIVWIEMDPAQEEVYTAVRSGFSGLIQKVEQDGVQAHRMEVLEAILRLRQVCCDPRLLGDAVAGAKIKQLAADVGEIVADGRKVLIFSQFTSMLQLIRKELDFYRPLYLDGSVGAEKRGELVRAFQEDPASSVFLLSLKAGGVGLNLTAADYVLLFDPWWNEAVERQAIDRAHRIGQKKTVFAKRYLIPGTIEEKMLQLKEKKQTAADQLLDLHSENGNWTEEEILNLLT